MGHALGLLRWRGDDPGRIAHERAERDGYGIPSLDATVAVLREFLRHGTTAVRSHVDVDLGVGLRGLEIVRQAVAELGDAVEVEIVAFPQDGVLRRPGVLKLLDKAAAAGATSIGGLDPASIDRDPVGQLDALFEVATRRGVGLDIHLHDGGELGAFQFELIERTSLPGCRGGQCSIGAGDVSPRPSGETLSRAWRGRHLLTSVAPADIPTLARCSRPG